MVRKKINANDKTLLKNEKWCIGDQTTGYSYDNTGEVVGIVTDLIDSHTSFYFTASNKYRVTKTPSYKCETTGVSGEKDENKVGMLTFDEIVYAGGGNSSNSNYYLFSNTGTNSWFALSPGWFSYGYVYTFGVNNKGELNDAFEPNSAHYALRPSITLLSNIKISSGTGTVENPYEIVS